MPDQIAEDRNIRAAERAHDLINDRGKQLTDASTRDAQEAIKVGLLINSGAAVAILAFIASLASKTSIALGDLRPVINCLYWFTGGIVAAGVTSAFAYLSNSLYSANFFEQAKTWKHPYAESTPKSERAFRWARFFNWAGFILAWVALLLFVAGVFMAAHAISGLVHK